MKRKKEKLYLIIFVSMFLVILILAFVLLFGKIKEPVPIEQGSRISQIEFKDEKIILNMPSDYSWASVENWSITSMYPTIRQTSILIALKVDEETEINLDDIIIFDVPPKYYHKNTTGWLHRVVKKGTDFEGEFFRTKGDSNRIIDPFKTRRENVTHIIVAIIY